MTPTTLPAPPFAQVTGPITGAPEIPPPTAGSVSACSRPTFVGQPATKGFPPLCWFPSDWIAYSREFVSARPDGGLPPRGTRILPIDPIRPTEAALKFAALYGPSLPWLALYSSFVPTTISGF